MFWSVSDISGHGLLKEAQFHTGSDKIGFRYIG